MRGIFAFVAIFGLSACTSVMEPKITVNPLEQDTIVSGTPSLRQTFVTKTGTNLFVCAEPMADAAFDYAESGSLALSFLNFSSGDKSAGEEASSQEMELGGRTPGVLQTRELLYRLCEFDRNHTLDSNTAITLYKRNLEIIEKIVTTEAQNTQITVGDTVATEIKETQTDTEDFTNQNAQKPKKKQPPSEENSNEENSDSEY